MFKEGVFCFYIFRLVFFLGGGGWTNSVALRLSGQYKLQEMSTETIKQSCDGTYNPFAYP